MRSVCRKQGAAFDEMARNAAAHTAEPGRYCWRLSYGESKGKAEGRADEKLQPGTHIYEVEHLGIGGPDVPAPESLCEKGGMMSAVEEYVFRLRHEKGAG